VVTKRIKNERGNYLLRILARICDPFWENPPKRGLQFFFYFSLLAGTTKVIGQVFKV